MESKFLGSTGLAKFLENLYNVFSMVGHTHTKSQITDFPTIPSNVSQLTNDSGFVTAEQVTMIIPVDSTMSDTSEHPVQNKVIKAQFDSVDIKIENTAKDIRNEIPEYTAISNEVIDSICGNSIVMASEVMF